MKYNFKDHVGLFLLYNIPFAVFFLCLCVAVFIGLDTRMTIGESLRNYWYDGALTNYGGGVAWRIHVVINVFIAIIVAISSNTDRPNDPYYD